MLTQALSPCQPTLLCLKWQPEPPDPDSGSLQLGVHPGAMPEVMPGGRGLRSPPAPRLMRLAAHWTLSFIRTPDLQNGDAHGYCSGLL